MQKVPNVMQRRQDLVARTAQGNAAFSAHLVLSPLCGGRRARLEFAVWAPSHGWCIRDAGIGPLPSP